MTSRSAAPSGADTSLRSPAFLSLNRVQKELGVSYPTVRSRLEEVIHALGYEVREDQESEAEERQKVLEQLARKEISSEEALRVLQRE